MATFNAPTLARPQYTGEAPLAAAHGKFQFAAHPIATRVRLFKLHAGSKILDFRGIFEALGAGVTVSLGIELVASGIAVDTYLSAAVAANAAGNVVMGNKAPMVLTEDAYVTAVIGGGAATGQFDAVLKYAPDGV